MGDSQNNNANKNTHKKSTSSSLTSSSSLHFLTMLTSIVAAAVITTTNVTAAVASVDGESQQHPDASYETPPIERQAIPFCQGAEYERSIGRRLLYISTLDGRLSALDITKAGKLRWSVPTGPGPLISSSIHRLELTNNGQFVRMIPSLSGGIYKFDGEYIDPIPITAENLLSSSARFSDDLVISGGKETRSYGVSARTGQLLYECSMDGCVNATDNETTPATVSDSADEYRDKDFLMEHDPLADDVIIVRRQTQTVRAVESRTGIERWNFSVGQHELDLVPASDCHERPLHDIDLAIADLDIKVVVPEGLICAFNKNAPDIMLWKYKFDHPIVSGWKFGRTDELEKIDMFGSAHWLWERDENIFNPPYPSISPSVYLGMYEKQLYIQESVNLRKEIFDQSNMYNELGTTEATLPKIPWRPIAVSSNSLVIFKDDNVMSGSLPTSQPLNEEIVETGQELMPYNEDNFAVSAQSVLNASEYVNGNGFYLYTREELNKTNRALCDKTADETLNVEEIDKHSNVTTANNQTITDDLSFNMDDIDAPVKVVILSLWFWWKEIILIAVTSAIALNLMIGQRQRTEREIVVIERHIPVPTAFEATEQSTAALLGPITNSSSKSKSGSALTRRTLSESNSQSSENFSSRFQEDFDLLRCLGRGGFGVVFEAKNKIDDVKYAIKRITLPNKKESRDRVMREAKTLANCEHQNIVRYFQAWVETPPPGWQEEEDNKWLAHEMSTSIQIETPDGSTLPSIAGNLEDAKQIKGHHLQMEKKRQLLSWVSSVTSTACSTDHGVHDCIDEKGEVADYEDHDNDDDDDDEDDDSCVIFRTESQSQALKEDEEEEGDDQDGASGDGSTETKKPNQRKFKTDSISIDIHSDSFDLKTRKKIDVSQLSDSFQIEFVRSTNGLSNGVYGIEEKYTTEDFKNDLNSNFKSKSRPQSLEINQKHNNNHNSYNYDSDNCKALVPTAVSFPVTPKPNKNKKLYLYIQMQLCRKESLRDWLRENKIEARQDFIASIFHQIVNAVDYVHFKGLIHRDLKPSNIFFSQDGQIKIGDFGLVTDMSDIPNLVTKCGDKTGLPSCARHTQQVGTHLYMSPEQLRGEPYDFKVDIFSLGLIFFELLMYFNTEMERIITLRDVREGRYPKEFSTEHPAEFELLQAMLSASPNERPTTSELKTKLYQLLKLPDSPTESEPSNRRLSHRTISSSE